MIVGVSSCELSATGNAQAGASSPTDERKFALTEDADRSSSTDGPLGRVKAALAKATQAVVGIVKKDDTAGAGADGKPTERAKKMKAAVEEARKAKNDD